MNEEIKETLEWLKECAEDGFIFETGNAKILYDYIVKLKKENLNYKENKNNTFRYLEKNRIREKAIVDINALEGILNEGF